MFNSFRGALRSYPHQFWLLFSGMLISTTGSSMIWPFLMLYVSKRLSLPLTQVAALLTISSVMGLIFAFVAGPITDRFGRKWVMVISLAVNGICYIFMAFADTFVSFAILQALMGAFNPLYRVGADAMTADLITEEKRPEAYSFMRMSNNVGVAIGPALGGLLASRSYSTAFFLAAAGMITYAVLLLVRANETLPEPTGDLPAETAMLAGYDRIFHDGRFMGFILAFTLTSMMSSMMWTMLPVYTNRQFGLPENLYGLIPTTNALMVVFFQYFVTQRTRKKPMIPVMAVGATFYMIATISVSFFSSFWGFWTCMVVHTLGELMLVPTATTFTANLAPPDMRGRYMSVFGLTWNVASGIAPLIGGFLSDQFSPVTTWYGSGVIGLISILVYAFIALRSGRSRTVTG
jgi:MFS family permease